MLGLEAYAARSSRLDPALRELVKFRASQINGCAYCLDMHSKDARAHGETEQRLYALQCLAGNSLFHGPRARGACLDRSHYIDQRNARPGFALRGSP